MNKKIILQRSLLIFLLAPACIVAQQERAFDKIVFGCYSPTLQSFESFAQKAKDLGASHITITAEDLPLRYWELTPPEDPYPAWVITNPGLLKLLPPDPLKSYIPQQYGQGVIDILQERCAVLRRLDLKAAASII